MSALESISEWTEDNFTAKKNETPFELFDRIDAAFAADFRIDLDKILKGDMDAFLKFLEDKIERDQEQREKKREDRFIDRMTKTITNFLNRLFR